MPNGTPTVANNFTDSGTFNATSDQNDGETTNASVSGTNYTPPPTISSASLAPTTAASFSAPTPTPVYPVSSLPVAAPSDGSSAYSLTSSQGAAQDTSTQLESLNNELSGKSAFETNAYNSLGYGVSTDANGNIVANDPTLNDLNTKLTTLSNEAKAIPLQLQNNATGQDVTQGEIAPVQNAQLRQNAIEALTVSSLVAARQGNMATATMMVNNAVTQKFGPIQAQYDALTKNLSLIQNSPEYTTEQKQQAAEQAQSVAQASAQLDIAKTNYTTGMTEINKYAPIADGATLQAMSQAIQNGGTSADVDTIAAQAGLNLPSSSRYKDVTTRNIDGTTSAHILDSTTGQFVTGLPAGTTAADLNGSSDGSAAGGSASYSGVPGTTGSATIDTTSEGYTSTPVPDAGGLTQAAIDQKALSYLTSGTPPPQGRTGLAGLQNSAVANRMAEMDAGGNLAANKATLKALSTSLTTQQGYHDTTQRAFNTANDTLTALQSYMTQNGINPSQFPDFNTFSTYLKSKGIDPGAAGGYNAQIATLQQEYSQVLAKGGARSVETDKEAAHLIPPNLAPAQLAQVAAQIKIDATNVTNDAQNQITQIQGQINHIISPSSSTSAPSTLPQPVQDTITKNVTFSPDGKTAYLPRSVWSTLGSSMDAVLAEAKADGYTLLIQ